MNDTFQRIVALDLAAKTSNAYAFDTYGMSEWVNIICFLRGEGYTLPQITKILHSKIMRRADCKTADEFKKYYFAMNKPGTGPARKRIERFLEIKEVCYYTLNKIANGERKHQSKTRGTE